MNRFLHTFAMIGLSLSLMSSAGFSIENEGLPTKTDPARRSDSQSPVSGGPVGAQGALPVNGDLSEDDALAVALAASDPDGGKASSSCVGGDDPEFARVLAASQRMAEDEEVLRRVLEQSRREEEERKRRVKEARKNQSECTQLATGTEYAYKNGQTLRIRNENLQIRSTSGAGNSCGLRAVLQSNSGIFDLRGNTITVEVLRREFGGWLQKSPNLFDLGTHVNQTNVVKAIQDLKNGNMLNDKVIQFLFPEFLMQEKGWDPFTVSLIGENQGKKSLLIIPGRNIPGARTVYVYHSGGHYQMVT